MGIPRDSSSDRNALDALNAEHFQKLLQLEDEENLTFGRAVQILGLDPEKDFRFADLSTLSISKDDLKGFNLDGSRLKVFPDWGHSSTQESKNFSFNCVEHMLFHKFPKFCGDLKRAVDFAGTLEAGFDSDRLTAEASLKVLEKEIVKGSFTAAYWLALLLLYGTSKQPSSLDHAIEMLSRSSSENPDALNDIAVCKWCGLSADGHDKEVAFDCFEHLAKTTAANAKFNHALCLVDGSHKVELEEHAQAYLYLELSKLGDKRASLNFIVQYLIRDLNFSERYLELRGEEFLEELASGGDIAAQYNLCLYRLGLLGGNAQYAVEWAKLIEKAVEKYSAIRQEFSRRFNEGGLLDVMYARSC